MQEMGGGGQLEYLLDGRRLKVLILLHTIEYDLCSNLKPFKVSLLAEVSEQKGDRFFIHD